MAEPKTKLNKASVDKFLAAIPDAQKRADAISVSKMMRKATGEPAKMWGKSIVGFGTYHYVYASGRSGDWMQVGFSPRKANLTLYIMPGFSGYAPLLGKLGKFKTGKSCLYINRLSDVDVKVLEKLIADSVAYMRKKYGNKAMTAATAPNKTKKKSTKKKSTKKKSTKKKSTKKKSTKKKATKKKATKKKATKKKATKKKATKKKATKKKATKKKATKKKATKKKATKKKAAKRKTKKSKR